MKNTTRFLLCWLLLGLVLTLAAPALAQAEPVIPTEPVQWDGQSRFTVLLLGMDRRPGARDNLNARTDSIQLVSYDPQARKLGILDIPRDIHFALLDVGQLVRVNTLLVRGESRQEGYGPYFAIDVFQRNLGMYVDAYVAFDFEAFITFIDALGGIEISINYTINDPTYPDMNYGYDPFYLPRGTHTLDGRAALKFARTRHGDNDYLRGERQLQVIQAVRDRLKDPAVLRGLLDQAPALIAELESNIYTNLPPDQLIMLGLAMLELDEGDIVTAVLNQQYSYEYRTPEGTVRVPDRTRLAELLISVFGETYYGG